VRNLAPIFSLFFASSVLAQQRPLERADSLLLAGQYAQARTTLSDWQRANPIGAQAEPADRAKALYLSARLTTDAVTAQDQYLSLVLSYPTARETPDALLRLGQGFLAAGDPDKAQGYLERLVNEYPTSPNRIQGYLWLARAQQAARESAAACNTATAGLRAGPPNDELGALLRTEEGEACAAAQRNPAPVARAVAPRPSPPRPNAAPPATRPAPTARYALQAGAFREVASARALAAELSRKGFDARVVYVANSPLARVRIGRFASAAATTRDAQRLARAGIKVIVVGDATRERTQR
jgi:TolA-binding protein